jgi:hypothetical protein
LPERAKITKCLQLMVSLHWQSHELRAGCQSIHDMLVFHHRAAHV